MRFPNDPTHGITTDPVTGRRYVLAYVELGTRVVEAIHRENVQRGDDATQGESQRSKRRAVMHRARVAKFRSDPRYVPRNTIEGTRWRREETA